MASEEVFEELRPGLTRASYQILGSWADAEDIVQTTWLKWRRHHDSVVSPHAWLT
jgi:RNA polymerase sigma-70 factor (ECF subfamily)